MNSPSIETDATPRGWQRISEFCRERWLGPHRAPVLFALLAVAVFTLLHLGLLLTSAEAAKWRAAPVARGLAATTNMESRSRCGDRIAVECSGNGLYTFGNCVWTCRTDFNQHHFVGGEDEARERARQQVIRPNDRQSDGSPNLVDRVGDNRTTDLKQIDPVAFELRRIPNVDHESLNNTAALFQTAYLLYFSDRWFPDHASIPTLANRITTSSQ